MRRISLFNHYWRCFFIQGSWSYKSMIGLGFCFCMLPVLKRMYAEPEERKAFLQRHLEFFNSHPFFVSWCLGAVVKLEEESVRKGWANYTPISIFKQRLMGPLGAIGDQLFWSGLKPAAAALAVWLALSNGWIAIPVFLIVYNVPVFYFRALGLQRGYRKGFDIVADLSLRRFQPWYDVCVGLGVIFTGMCLMAAVDWNLTQGMRFLIAFILALPVALVLLYLKRSINLILVLTALVAVLFGLFI
ncbi:MAG: Mannose permease IID component [bacterium ADurb.Bin478]|nr:MAG: Mannose permease IID component [bacterium ADurb.Bin478]